MEDHLAASHCIGVSGPIRKLSKDWNSSQGGYARRCLLTAYESTNLPASGNKRLNKSPSHKSGPACNERHLLLIAKLIHDHFLHVIYEMAIMPFKIHKMNHVRYNQELGVGQRDEDRQSRG